MDIVTEGVKKSTQRRISDLYFSEHPWVLLAFWIVFL